MQPANFDVVLTRRHLGTIKMLIDCFAQFAKGGNHLEFIKLKQLIKHEFEEYRIIEAFHQGILAESITIKMTAENLIALKIFIDSRDKKCFNKNFYQEVEELEEKDYKFDHRQRFDDQDFAPANEVYYFRYGKRYHSANAMMLIRVTMNIASPDVYALHS